MNARPVPWITRLLGAGFALLLGAGCAVYPDGTAVLLPPPPPVVIAPAPVIVAPAYAYRTYYRPNYGYGWRNYGYVRPYGGGYRGGFYAGRGYYRGGGYRGGYWR